MKRSLLILVALLVPTPAWALNVGDKAPDFALQDITGHTFRLSSFKRKFLAVWYEGNASRSQNRWLKRRYKALRRSGRLNRNNLETIAIANYQESALPNRVLDAAIRYHVKRKGGTILLDRQGVMMRRWGFRNGRSNLYVFDQKRRLIWKSSGPLTKRRARQLLRFLRRLSAR